MNLNQLEYVLKELGCRNIKEEDGKLKCSCPFAPYTHGGGSDNHPSFYVFNNKNNVPGYDCHACKMQGSLLNLLLELKKRTKKDYLDIRSYIKDRTPIAIEAFKKKVEKSKSYYNNRPFEYFNEGGTSFRLEEEDLIKELSEDQLKYFSKIPQEVLEYLTGPIRKLTKKTIAVWEIGWHNRGYVSLPVRSIDGKLVGISGRAFDQERRPKYLHSEGFDRNKILYGENKISKGGKCHLVEGHFDVQWLWQNGYSNPLGVMGTYLSEYNAKKIVKWFNEVTIVSDGDVAGLKAQKDWYNLLKDRISVTIARTFKDKDPNKLTLEELKFSLGDPTNKKLLTSWFRSDKNTISWQGSLTSEVEGEAMDCARCNRTFQVDDSVESSVLEVKLQSNSIITLNMREVCDSCVKDIERLCRQIKAIPDIED